MPGSGPALADARGRTAGARTPRDFHSPQPRQCRAAGPVAVDLSGSSTNVVPKECQGAGETHRIAFQGALISTLLKPTAGTSPSAANAGRAAGVSEDIRSMSTK